MKRPRPAWVAFALLPSPFALLIAHSSVTVVVAPSVTVTGYVRGLPPAGVTSRVYGPGAIWSTTVTPPLMVISATPLHQQRTYSSPFGWMRRAVARRLAFARSASLPPRGKARRISPDGTSAWIVCEP